MLLSLRDDVMLWTFKKWRNSGLRCSVLSRRVSRNLSVSNQLLDELNRTEQGLDYCGVLVSPELPKWQTHHGYGCCRVNRT